MMPLELTAQLDFLALPLVHHIAVHAQPEHPVLGAYPLVQLVMRVTTAAIKHQAVQNAIPANSVNQELDTVSHVTQVKSGQCLQDLARLA